MQEVIRNRIEMIWPSGSGMERIAAAFRREIAEYRIPASVRKKTGIRNLSQVDAPWLIVLCDESAPANAEIEEKIRAFSEAGNYGKILTLLVSGAPDRSFPHALLFEEKEDGTVVEHEPLAANIVASSERESLHLLKVEKLRILAPILGVSFDELNDRRRKQKLRIVLGAGGLVFAAACGFLAFAAIRMQTISAKNNDLEEQYALIDRAREEAEEERTEAQTQLAKTVSVNAEKRLEEGDTELALLLCMHLLPGAGEGTELEEVFVRALERLCEAGYRPVTTADAYERDRYEAVPEEDPDCPYAASLTMRIPDGYFAQGKDTFSMKLGGWSREYGFAVYNGSFYPEDEEGNRLSSVYFTRICYAEHPEKDHYVQGTDGGSSPFYTPLILSDGRLAEVSWHAETGDALYLYDPESRSYEDVSGIVTEVGDVTLNELRMYPDCPYLLGETRIGGEMNTSGGIFVYDPETLDYLYTIEGVKEFDYEEGVDVLFGRTGEGIAVYSPDPLEQRGFIEYGILGTGPAIYAAQYADGSAYAALVGNGGKALISLTTQKQITRILSNSQIGSDGEGNISWTNQFSSEGLFVTAVGDTVMVYDLQTGEKVREIPGAGNNPDLYGPIDSATGLRSASAIRCGKMYHVYEYQEEEIPLPVTLSEQLALAERFLKGRTLTESELEEYFPES